MKLQAEKFKVQASTYLATRDDVLFAYLFGSYVKGAVTNMSDIDIAVYTVSDTIDSDTRLSLLRDLSWALKKDKLDLVFLNTAPVSLSYRILQNHMLLTDKDPLQRHQFESLVIRKYFDFSHLEKRILESRFANG
jgi:predicted nucleotidyltransferase